MRGTRDSEAKFAAEGDKHHARPEIEQDIGCGVVGAVEIGVGYLGDDAPEKEVPLEPQVPSIKVLHEA